MNNIEILGMLFGATNNKPADKRAENCRRSVYSRQNIGMSYPGVAFECESIYLENDVSCHIIVWVGLRVTG